MENTYFDELKATMEWIAKQDNTIFIGQTVAGPGTFMYQTLRDLPKEKTWEMPINESFQMQFTLGVALAGKIPISVYPRQNFLLLATADMTNMVDKMPDISEGKCKPHMIIRVASGPNYPVHPGHQHIGNYYLAFRELFKNITVFEINEIGTIFPTYKHAVEYPGLYLIIENGNFYNEEYRKKTYTKEGVENNG